MMTSDDVITLQLINYHHTKIKFAEVIWNLATSRPRPFFSLKDGNMAIDLKTNGGEISKAWQDIFDDKSETDW